MADFKSFSKHENELAHNFRNKLNHAESSEDVKKFFNYTIQELLTQALGEGIEIRYEDIALGAGGSGYTLSGRLQTDPSFSALTKTSDINAIIQRFAESAQHRVRHLEGHPEKTQSKIRGH